MWRSIRRGRATRLPTSRRAAELPWSSWRERSCRLWPRWIAAGMRKASLPLRSRPDRRNRGHVPEARRDRNVSGTCSGSLEGSERVPGSDGMRNIRLVIEYDGTAYCGWQRQENGLSIQQLLEESIGRMTGEAIRVIGSGRTDAGVHALRQVAHFHTASMLGERNFLMGINSLLPADIVVREVREVDPSFHARYSAKSKVYLYRICNRPVRSALE